jgi:hypothetical protein
VTQPLDDSPDLQRTEVLRFVERFALVLTESGFPRMPARVFSYALTQDADRYAAAQLAEGLGVSPAAISGAVRYLVQIGLLAREREPGARSDVYRVYDDDVWGTIFLQRLPVLERYAQAAAEGAALLPPDSAGARRLRETQEFYLFLQAEERKVFERWFEHRSRLFGQEGRGG